MLARTVGSGITIEVIADPSVPSALADPAELEHALVNLVVNARDAMPNGGTIRIATGVAASPTDPMVTLTVSDSGTGMDEATRARVFEPFFSTKPEGVGTGLGLPTAWAAVTAWGGTIDVASEPGVGTTFTLRLRPPRAPDPAGARSERRGGDPTDHEGDPGELGSRRAPRREGPCSARPS
jgi:signal transduction histidine kinase